MREGEVRSRAFAKHLRAHLTQAETILWSRLQHRSQSYAKFRRQHPIGPYIADFACIAAKLVVEVDGITHYSPEDRAYDLRRDRFMEARGWTILRISNYNIYTNLDQEFERIMSKVPPPSRTDDVRARHLP